ncbi:hypothetical protein [Leifsonia shinshuensis]
MTEPGDAVVPMTGSDAVETRQAATAARAELARRTAELARLEQEACADLEKRRAQLEAEFAKRRGELEAAARPLREQLERLTEVMWTVDLYLGRDETLRLIREGEPAPADTSITLRQRVLVMAEESLVMMGRKTTGMTAENIPEFVDWLLADPANLDRVLPEPKGVVVLIPTKVKTRSGNAFEDAFRDAGNQQSWWLLRNGERLYLLTVDPELRIHDRVLPRRTEFSEVFDRHLFGFGRPLGEPVRPGSDEWLKLEKVADARRRHYMRVLMVLQGIIDRTPVWHPLPEGGASFLRLADQDAGKIVLVQDGDDSLQLTDGRETFREYQRRLNAQLRPGMRVIGNWHARDFQELYVKGDRWSRGFHPRLHPGNLYERPKADVPHLIEGRRDGGLVIRFKRTEKIEKRNVPVPDDPGYVWPIAYVEPTQRASCVIMTDDTWVLPYDLVTVPELEHYLNSRDNRSDYFLSMVPTIQAALAAKRAEAEQEAPFRDLIARNLIMAGADPEQAPALVDELVHWWKVANLWARPLNGEPEHEAKAASQIIAEYKALAARPDTEDIEAIIAAGCAVPGAIAVAQDKQGRWKAFAPSTPAHDAGVFLDVVPIRRDGTLGAPEREKIITRRSATSLHVAWSGPEWSTWSFGANRNHYLTQAERTQLVDEIRQVDSGRTICVTERFDPAAPGTRILVAYSWASGTPADAPIIPDDDPLSSYRHDSVETAVRAIVKDATGVRLVDARGESAPGFSAYTSRSRWGSTPWWPDDAHRYADVRPRLVWADEDVLDEIKAYRDRCAEAYALQRKQRDERAAAAYRYSRPLEDIIRARQEQAAHDRFVEDFGANAEDLWPAHLASLNLSAPIHSRDLWGIIAAALEHGHDVVGRTLADLAELAWQHQNQAGGGVAHPQPRRRRRVRGHHRPRTRRRRTA